MDVLLMFGALIVVLVLAAVLTFNQDAPPGYGYSDDPWWKPWGKKWWK